VKLEDVTLKSILVKSGYINEADFDRAQKDAHDIGKKLQDVLVFRGLIGEDALSKLISEHLGMPHIDIGKQVIADEILNLLPEKLARTYHMIPFAKDVQGIKVAMDDPKNGGSDIATLCGE
jgi:hypothetical protein